MRNIVYLLFVWGWLLSQVCVAQPICQIQHFSVDDGLSQSIVQRIIQDKKGFIWFGTWNGLDRYDGYTFRNYKESADGNSPLTSYRLNYISESTKGDIWCQSYDERLFLFDTNTECFIDVLKPVEEKMKIKLYVSRFYPLANGITWVWCKNGYACRIVESKLGTDEGITLYSTSDRLKGEKLHGIYLDSDNDEWILTDKGITLMGKKKIESDFPFTQMVEHRRTIYLVSSSGKLAAYEMKTQKLSFPGNEQPMETITKMEILGRDTLALSTRNGLELYHIRTKTFQHIDVGMPGTPDNVVRNLYKDSHGYCWLITQGSGVVRLDLHTLTTKTYHQPAYKWGGSFDRRPTTFFHEDLNGTLWILPSDGHLCYYDRDADALLFYQLHTEAGTSVYNPFIRFFMTDRQGDMWLVLNFGLDKIAVLPYKVQLHDIDTGVELRAFMTDPSKRLWVGSKTGKVRIYSPQGQLEGYLSPDGRITKQETAFASGVYVIMQDCDGDVWIGTKQHGLYRMERRSETAYRVTHWTHDKGDAYSLSGNSVVSVFQDSKKRMWVGCFEAGINLLRKDETTGHIAFINHRNELKSYPYEVGLKVRCLAEAANGTMLVGTTNGLLTFSGNFHQPEEIKFYRNEKRMGDKTSLPGNDVMYILKSKKGGLYLFTFSGGMSSPLQDDLLTDRIAFKSYTKRDGLVSELVQSATEDAEGNIWIVHEDAISKFTPASARFENYRSNLFRANLKFSEAIPVINAKGHLIAGTNYGMFDFAIRNVSKSHYVPPVNLTRILTQGDRNAPLSADGKVLRLSADERNVTFQFAAIDYVNSQDIRYAYRMKGLEKEWNYTDRVRQARYMNLPAGTYTFEVRSTNGDGVWQHNIKQIQVVVQPRFRETVWAWILYILAFVALGGVVMYIWFYIYKLRHSVVMEQQLADIRLRFFTNISHELRTPLTLITSPLSEVLSSEQLPEKVRTNLQIVDKNAQRMLRMMNQILDFRKIQKGKMKVFLERVNVMESLHGVLESFSSMAFDKHIKVNFDTEEEELYMWTDADKFDKIFFNLVSNAFKYTPEGKEITLRIRRKDNKVSIQVEDQGVGIEPSEQKHIFVRFETLGTSSSMQPSSGIGLSLVKDMVEMLHGTIRLESEVGKGSRFTVTLPTDRVAFENDSKVELVMNDGEQAASAPVPVRPEENAEDMEQDDVPSLLIVEDNAEMRAFLTNILRDNYKIYTAENGEQGLKIARESQPDMILTDVMMPVMDGLEMVRRLKEDTETSHIPLIVLSAKSSLDDRIAALDEGIDDYITKPFSATYLKARIAHLFKQRASLQESYLRALSLKEQGEPEVGKDRTAEETPKPKLTPKDEEFMQRVLDMLDKNLDNQELSMEDFAMKLCMSRTVFYRKLKSIVGVTPVEFMRDIRIKKAAQLIEHTDYSFSQVAYMTGFADAKYFGKCFKKVMGVTPTEYRMNKEN